MTTRYCDHVYKNSNLVFPRARLTINLALANLRKEGPAYDLPIALGVLAASEQVPVDALDGAMVVGELSLDGSVRHVRGALSMAAKAREQGIKTLYLPAEDAAEAAIIPDVNVIGVPNLAELVNHLFGAVTLESLDPLSLADAEPPPVTDLQEIKGQEHVKRALEVAAAGSHNVIMVGPPGAGKTLLARAMPGIMPALSIDEALEVTKIYSVSDLLPPETPLIQVRPFRAPHHTISHAGLVGGGQWPRPGEVSLAHRGVLFLDELPEFGQRTLEVLRQPLEDKQVTTLTRSHTPHSSRILSADSHRFPARPRACADATTSPGNDSATTAMCFPTTASYQRELAMCG